MHSPSDYRSEIRDSVVRDLLEKCRKRNFAKYLTAVRLENIRMFTGAEIRFDFPVTALIGPNGGGKSTVLGASACAYTSIGPDRIFRRSRIGDEAKLEWSIEHEIVDKGIAPTSTIRFRTTFSDNKWAREKVVDREAHLLSITRTLPATESPHFHLRRKLSTHSGDKVTFSTNPISGIDHVRYEAERILGKSLRFFELLEVTSVTQKSKKKWKRRSQLKSLAEYQPEHENEHVLVVERRAATAKQLIYVGGDGKNRFSEFNFGAGEASVIRTVATIEQAQDHSLVLIEEIENGLHPLAVRRLVEYLMEVARRKSIQTIFTTHSDYAIAPLPSEAIWSAMDGTLQQGKLSIDVLRAVSGRIDKALAVFVEDEFARAWVEAILREKLPDRIDEIGIYAVHGDSNATRVHLGHTQNPAVTFHSICFVDGDSRQKDNAAQRIYRLPGLAPESAVFDSVLKNLDNNIALLTVACHRSIDKQRFVADAVRQVSHTNRDPHLLFSQLGIKLQFLPESIVRGAFFTVWLQENVDEAETVANRVREALSLPPKKAGTA